MLVIFCIHLFFRHLYQRFKTYTVSYQHPGNISSQTVKLCAHLASTTNLLAMAATKAMKAMPAMKSVMKAKDGMNSAMKANNDAKRDMKATNGMKSAMKATNAMKSAMKATNAMKAKNNKSMNTACVGAMKVAVRATAMARNKNSSKAAEKTVLNAFKKYITPIVTEYHLIKAYNSRFKVKYPKSLAESLDIFPAYVFCCLWFLC